MSGKHSLQLRKVTRIALHEFRSTALTKGFIIGVLIVPVILAVVMPLIVFLVEISKPPVVSGRLALVDRSGAVAGLVAERLAPEAMAERRADEAGRVAAEAEDRLGELSRAAPMSISGAAKVAAAASAVPRIVVEVAPPGADEAALRAAVQQAMAQDLPLDDPAASRLLGVAVVAADAVRPAAEGGELGGFELMMDKKVDKRTVGEIDDALRDAIRDARFEAAGYDRALVNRLEGVNAQVQEITEAGTRESNEALTMLMPGAFMLLILMSVLTGGQYLLTTTIEEKSSRVVEVLLSSVSAMELMAGKIIGQMLVGLALLVVYSGLGIVALVTLLDRLDLVQPGQIAAMLVFFVLAYFMIASLMAAAGSAVNELREAQSLMTPIMLIAMIPYFLFLPVSMSPSAAYSVALSYVPPINPFIMMIRVASNDPPPLWEVGLSVLVGAAGCVACLWLTAKVFRVGLLMYGKPPNLVTLWKWVRMA